MMQSPSSSVFGNQVNSTHTLSTALPTTNLLAANPLNVGPAMTGARQSIHTFTVSNLSDNLADPHSLRGAIAAANADASGAADVINFNLTGTGPQTIQLQPNLGVLDITAKNLAIMNGTGADNLIISGGKQVEDFQIEAGANVTLSGLTITQGKIAADNHGGGITNYGTLTLNNDTISNNFALTGIGGGGGIYNTGTLTLNNDTISNNAVSLNAFGGGGGVYNKGTLTVNNSTFSGNSVIGGLLYNGGGGIYNKGTLTVNNSTFSGNSFTRGILGGNGDGRGGGIYNVPSDVGVGGTVTVSNSTFSNNSAIDGGGIYNNSGTITVSKSTFSNNAATGSSNLGGGIDNVNGTVNASGLFFSGNTSNVVGPVNFTVDSLADTPQGNNTLNAGHVTLRDALAAAGPGGIITFAPGLAGGTINLTSELDINNNVTIQGLGASQLTISGNNQFRDFMIGAGANVTISGLTIANGKTTEGGGGILNEGNLTATNDRFLNDTAAFGGAIYNDTFRGAKVNFTGSTFTGNTATQAPGNTNNNNNIFAIVHPNAITVDSLADTATGNPDLGKTTLRDALSVLAAGGTITFASNLAGGTLTLSQGELDLTKNVTIQGLGANQLTISGNHQFRDFMIGTGANVTISGLTIANGTTGDFGGGILNAGKLTLNQDMVQNNQAQFGGGIANGQGATLIVNASTINGNKVVQFGNPGVLLAGDGLVNLGTATLTNTTIANNGNIGSEGGIGNGGGIDNEATGILTLNNDTITHNSEFIGGGVFNLGTATVHNTIIAQNTAAAGRDITGTFLSKGFNLIGIEDLSDSTSFINGQKGDQVGTATNPIDPKLGLLQNNGGPTFTAALLTSSPAINTGDPTNGNNPTTDQRGINRPQRGRADSGAFELV